MSERVVWLRGYPVELGTSLVEHVEDWVREFKLMGLGREAGTATAPVPARLQALVSHLSATYADELSEPDRLRARAAARGEAVVDLPYPVRPETEQVVRSWDEVVRAVDDHCAAEGMLTLQRTAEQVRLHDWITEQFLRQLKGEPATPWHGPLAPV